MTHANPTVSIDEFGVAVPAWTIRLVAALAGAGVVWALAVDGAPPSVLVVVGLLGASGVLSPGSAAPAAMCGVAAIVSTVYSDAGALRPTVFALVFLVHLLHVSSGLAAAIPRGARLHTSTLRRPLLRFVLIQAGVLALAGVAAALPAGRNPAQLEVLAALGIAGLAALAIALLRRR